MFVQTIQSFIWVQTLVTAVSSIALTQMASAADLPRKAPAYVPPAPVPVADWSGVYVGLQGGYGWGHQKSDAILPFNKNGSVTCTDPEPCDNEDFDALAYGLDHIASPDLALGNIKQNGWLFGGFFGAQKQWGSWVLGIEGDIDAADIKGSGASSAASSLSFGDDKILSLNHSASLESKIDMLGSLRGKVGFVPAPNWLIYGTGGAAFAHVKNNLTDTQSLNMTDDLEPKFAGSNTFSASSGTSMFGWAAGAGVDWKWPVDAGSAWVFGVEYLHYGFGDQTITLTDNTGRSLSFAGKENVDTVKGRISYLFSIH